MLSGGIKATAGCTMHIFLESEDNDRFRITHASGCMAVVKSIKIHYRSDKIAAFFPASALLTIEVF